MDPEEAASNDLLYPDNAKREARMYQLANDIGTLLNDLANDAAEIKSCFEKVDKEVKQMYKDIKVDIPPSSMKTFDYKGWVVEVIDILHPFVEAAAYGLKNCAMSWLLREGRIGEAVFFDVAGTTWLKVAVSAGAITVTGGIALAIKGITGAVKRKKLREAIHSAIQPRIKLKKAAIVNGMLHNKLQTVIDSFTMMKQIGYTKEQLDEAPKKIAAAFKEEVNKVTDETAKKDLADLDKHRDSWTKEDSDD